MKTHASVSGQRRKARKAHFTAPSHLRRKIMSCHLSKDLKTKYDVRSIPVRKGDVVKIVRGSQKGRDGKVTAVYRKKWCLHVEKVQRDKTNGKQFIVLTTFRTASSDPHCGLQLHRDQP